MVQISLSNPLPDLFDSSVEEQTFLRQAVSSVENFNDALNRLDDYCDELCQQLGQDLFTLSVDGMVVSGDDLILKIANTKCLPYRSALYQQVLKRFGEQLLAAARERGYDQSKMYSFSLRNFQPVITKGIDVKGEPISDEQRHSMRFIFEGSEKWMSCSLSLRFYPENKIQFSPLEANISETVNEDNTFLQHCISLIKKDFGSQIVSSVMLNKPFDTPFFEQAECWRAIFNGQVIDEIMDKMEEMSSAALVPVILSNQKRKLTDIEQEIEELGKMSSVLRKNNNQRIEEGIEPLFDDVIEFIRHSGITSISGLQRRFQISFNQAARLLDQLEEQGIISPPDKDHKHHILTE